MPGGQIRPHQSQAPQQQSRAEDHADCGNDGVSSHDEENDASGQHRSAVDDRQRKIRIPLHAVTPTRTVVRAIIVRHRGPFCAASLPPACARGGFTATPIKMGGAPPGRHPRRRQPSVTQLLPPEHAVERAAPTRDDRLACRADRSAAGTGKVVLKLAEDAGALLVVLSCGDHPVGL